MSNLATQQWDSSQIEIIKQQIAKGCSDGELALFGQVCTKTGLDPFSRQIYAISRGGKLTIQVSIDGFRTIAARSGLYGGSTTEWCGDDGVWRDVWLSNSPPAAAKTTVWRKGSQNPFTGVARYGAYQQGNSMWSKMPEVMIGKVSESLALRKAFPAELSGLYTTEEMQQTDNPMTTSRAESQPDRTKEFNALKARLSLDDQTIKQIIADNFGCRISEMSNQQFEDFKALLIAVTSTPETIDITPEVG